MLQPPSVPPAATFAASSRRRSHQDSSHKTAQRIRYRGHGKGETFGPTYTSGDIVGAGINYAAQEFFFTKNGQVVGTQFTRT
ncbi:hypothetical protein PIB30_088246 [Stylosanthes scabra]|uniref:SPRY domain-containing protein n=1 Tax=Stylosanthes scabra TaxID=79078 RepID=A0ABU6YWG3_9FABA|nr:hypothetical protein [Stylosanthes scabra]